MNAVTSCPVVPAVPRPARSPRGKRQLPPIGACAKRHVSLSPYYERAIESRMEERHIGRSRAIASFIDDALRAFPPAPTPAPHPS